MDNTPVMSARVVRQQLLAFVEKVAESLIESEKRELCVSSRSVLACFDEAKQELVRQVYRKTKGGSRQVAKLCGCDRSTIQRWVKELGLEKEEKENDREAL